MRIMHEKNGVFNPVKPVFTVNNGIYIPQECENEILLYLPVLAQIRYQVQCMCVNHDMTAIAII